jgi:hypothetical protein
MRKRSAGFSLLEVVIAVGVLALTVVAMIGVVGPLLRGISDSRMSAELEAILAALRQWSAESAEVDFTTLRSEIRGEAERYVYRLESSLAGEGGWVVSNAQDFQRDLSQVSQSQFVRGPVACYLQLSSEAQISDNYEPVLIELWMAGVPEPNSDLADWQSALEGRQPDYTVRLVIHR